MASKYQYNDSLQLQHLAPGDRRGAYWLDENDDCSCACLLMIKENEGYVVAAFNDKGFCTNARGHNTKKEAARSFYEEITGEPFPESNGIVKRGPLPEWAQKAISEAIRAERER